MKVRVSVLLLLLAAFAQGAERRAGVIRLSNGQEHKGEIWFQGSEPRIYEGEGAAGGRFVNVKLEEFASLTFFIRTQSTERPWRFKNAGSDEKEFLPGEYPVVDLGVEAKLLSGQTLKGHLLNKPVYIRTPDGENPMDYLEQKFHLKFQMQGDVGQKAADLVYVKEIVFDGGEAAPEAGNGVLAGTLKGFGALQQVAAYGIERMRAYEGKVLDATQGTYRIERLPPDRYDVALLTDRGIWVGLSDQAATAADARPLEAGDEAAIAATLAKFDDFFDVQGVVAVRGHREAAKVLVHQRRVKEQHDEAGLKGQELNRLDIWSWHLRTTEWHINPRGRANLFRYFEPRRGQPRPIQVLPALGGCVVDPAKEPEKSWSADAPKE
ncbi:MAG: hypothetical protein AMXMBFR7_35380 [Planctomycetota bacterium]